jgi:hypothetical protein
MASEDYRTESSQSPALSPAGRGIVRASMSRPPHSQFPQLCHSDREVLSFDLTEGKGNLLFCRHRGGTASPLIVSCAITNAAAQALLVLERLGTTEPCPMFSTGLLNLDVTSDLAFPTLIGSSLSKRRRCGNQLGRNELTPYSVRFCLQSFGVQDFGLKTPPTGMIPLDPRGEGYHVTSE